MSQLSDRPALLEREPELAALRAAAESARGGTGRVVVIEGPAGAGKSALLAAVPVDGLQVLRAAGGEWEREYAFGAIRQLFARVSTTLFAGAAALAAAVVATPAAASLEPGLALLDAIYWAMAGLAAQKPVLIAVDDLHWVDDASLQALGYLARRVPDLPVLLVGTVRPAEPGAPAERLDDLRGLAEVLAPAPLTPAAVAALVRADRPGADDAQCAALHAASAGNPLYVRELLLAGGEVDHGIPTLGERVVRRVARVAPEAPALAGALAVLGDGAPLALATDLAELDPATAQRIAHELVRIDILAGDAPPAFAHPVIRHSLYTALSGARRASLHAAAAEALETAGAPLDAVAGHLAAVPPAGSATVAARLRDAGVEAFGRGAVATTIARLRRAVAEGAPPDAELLFALGRAERFQGDPAARDHLEAALAEAEGPLRLQVRVALSELYAQGGLWSEAAVVIDGGAGEPDPDHELTAIRAALEANDPSRVDAFTASWDELARAAAAGTPASQAIAALLASEAVSRGRAAEVPGFVAAALGDGAIADTRYAGTWAAPQLIMALVLSDALDEAEVFARALTETGRRTGSTAHLLLGATVPAWTAGRRGNLAEAEARMELALEVVAEVHLTMWVTSAAWMFEDGLPERPAFDGFAQELAGLELPAAFDATYGGAALRGVRARLALARGDRAAALADLRSAEPTLRALGVGPARMPWRSRLALAAGDPAPAEEELAMARAAGYPRPIGIALRALGVLGDDVGLLRESLAVLETAPSALERAYTEVELGAALRRRGHVAEARDVLSAAADLSHHCGAERLLARALEELQATGARPRRPAATGVDALTPRERTIADLAAAGRTNSDIAQELFVSLKTVETHLTNAYAKLGLTGRGARAQLEAALRRRGTS